DGLTRVTDKRTARRDHADVFCMSPDGVRGQRAKEWRLVDAAVRTQDFANYVRQRAATLAGESDRPVETTGIVLTPLKRTADESGIHYEYVDVHLNRDARLATLTVRAPEVVSQQTVDEAVALGAAWWPMQMARELDDAILSLRTNELELGLWILKTIGNADAVVAADDFVLDHADHWFVREV